MSRHHQTHANDVSFILNSVRDMSREEIQAVYGIELNTDGTVFDPTYNQSFGSIGEWADFSVSQDEVEYSSHITHGYGAYDF